MTPPPNNSEFIELKGGLTLEVRAVLLALDLEYRGFSLHAQGDKLLLNRSDGVSASATLTEKDRSDIVKWKRHLLAIVDYHVEPTISVFG
jgi:hypothetical protein